MDEPREVPPEPVPRGSSGRTALGLLLGLAFLAGARIAPEFRADSVSYFVWLRSAYFDHDLDFANEWEHWGLKELPQTATGLRRNVHSVGPALLWSPFYVAADLYVAATGAFARDGYSLPYRRAAALGTLTAVVLGAWLLSRMLAPRAGPRTAALVVAATVLGSPIVYYALVVPTMAHGATFGASAALVWAWDRARRRPALQSWCVLGALLGVAALMRWQAAALALLVLPLAIHGLARRSVRPSWLLVAAAAVVAAFSPQLLAWHALYGRFLTIPQGEGFMDWSSPHLLDVLLSADHGLFAWTPLMLLGALGLVVLFQRGEYPQAAPLERVAGDQAGLLRRALQDVAGALGGPRASALVYKYLSAEYLYTRFNPGGTLALGNMEDRELRGAWSSRRRKPGEPAFRWALAPESCVRVPLDSPFDLRVAVTARAPQDVQPQVMTVAANGHVVGTAPVGTDWGESRFLVPALALVPGENWLCLRFSREWPGEEGLRAAAAVSTIQLP